MSDSLVSAYGPPTAEPSVERSSSTPAVSQSDRIYYLDNVRALAMLLGVFFHGALAYSSLGHTFWLIGDREGSLTLSLITWFSHLFRMGLFFLIAGYFAKLLIQKRGVKRFLLNRTLRIGLPIVVFLPIVSISMGLMFVFAAYYVQDPPPVLAVIKAMINGTPIPPEFAPADGAPKPPDETLAHLWFLYYLMMFAVLSALLSLINWTSGKRFIDWLYSKPAALLFIPIALLPALAMVGSPTPSPASLTPALWPFGFYGLFYFAGWCLRGREQAIDALSPYAWLLVGISMILYIPYYAYFPVQALVAKVEVEPWQNWLAMVLNAYIGVFMTVACLGLGKAYLSGHSKVMRFIADSSYWTYLLHLPLIMFIQVLMVDWHMNVWVKLLIAVSATFAISLITYVVFVRYTPIGWMLNGRKRSEKAITKSADQPAIAFGGPNASVSVTSNA